MVCPYTSNTSEWVEMDHQWNMIKVTSGSESWPTMKNVKKLLRRFFKLPRSKQWPQVWRSVHINRTLKKSSGPSIGLTMSGEGLPSAGPRGNVESGGFYTCEARCKSQSRILTMTKSHKWPKCVEYHLRVHYSIIVQFTQVFDWSDSLLILFENVELTHGFGT